jgi:hypothetical protein
VLALVFMQLMLALLLMLVMPVALKLAVPVSQPGHGSHPVPFGYADHDGVRGHRMCIIRLRRESVCL